MFQVWNGAFSEKEAKAEQKRSSTAKINPSAAVLLNGAAAPQFSRKEDRLQYTAACLEEQHHTQAPWRQSLSAAAPPQKRNIRFLRRRGTITSASAKKLKFDLIRSKLAEEYK